MRLLDADTAPVTELADPYRNPDAAPKGRRLSPATLDAVMRALRAGVPKRVIARTYGVSATTVRRCAAKLGEPVEQHVSDLSELADAERELRASGMDPQAVEDLIQTVRLGHLIRCDRERRSA